MLPPETALNLGRRSLPNAARHALGLATVTALSAFLFFVRLDQRALWSSHEGRAGQHAQVMLDTGCWGMPTLFTGTTDYQKPPLYYWIVAAVAWLRGGVVDAWAIRFPAAAAALMGVWLVYGLGTALGRPATGFIAALILATNLRYAWLSRVGRIDMPLALAISAVLACLWFAYRRMVGLPPFTHPTRAWRWMLPAYVAAAVAVMLKGPVGLLLPAVTFWLFLLLERHPVWPWNRKFWVLAHGLGLWWGIPLVLMIAGPWFLWASIVTEGDFARTFFVHHHLDRALGVEGLKAEPFWYYLPRIFIDLFPWSMLIPAAIGVALRESRRDPLSQAATRFVIAWLVGMFAFLSLIRFKRADYLLPLMPALALLLARFWDRLLDSREQRVGWQWVRGISGIMALSAVGVTAVVLALHDERVALWLLDSPHVSSLVHETDRMLFQQLQHALHGYPAVTLVATVVLAVGFGLVAVRRRLPILALTLFAAAWGTGFTFGVLHLLPRQEPLREQRTLAQLARGLRLPEEPLYYYGREDHQLMFYLGPQAHWLINREEFRPVIDRSDRPVFVIAELDRFLVRQEDWPDVKMVPLARNTDNPFGTHRDPLVLLTNAAGWRLVQSKGSAAGLAN